jgi:hypothetical protein
MFDLIGWPAGTVKRGRGRVGKVLHDHCMHHLQTLCRKLPGPHTNQSESRVGTIRIAQVKRKEFERRKVKKEEEFNGSFE